LYAVLLKADFHGAKMVVMSARSPADVGVGGVCVKETAQTIHIAHASAGAATVRVIKKQDAVLAVPLPSGVALVLHGPHWAFRSADRSGRKFKRRTNFLL
jgi:RNase P/RNase MRP subunit p29